MEYLKNEKGMYQYLEADILLLIKEFYAISILDHIKVTIPFKHSHEKWVKDFNEYKEKYFDFFAHMLYDYTTSPVLS